MFSVILITIWLTMAFCHCSKEWASPYAHDLWLFDIIMAPYFIIVDAINEHKEWNRIAKND